jgi:hypothetical protein
MSYPSYPKPGSQFYQPLVFEAQRRYEALVFLTQGYVDYPDPAPDEFQFRIDQPDQNGNVRVVDHFSYAPLAGYLNGSPVDLTIHFHESKGQFSVMAKLPSGFVDRKGGLLTLVWATGKVLTADALIKRAKRSKTKTFCLQASEAPYDSILEIVYMDEEPLEVWIGSREISDTGIRWEKNLLSIHIPRDVEPGHVIVITNTGTWVSDTHFRPTGFPVSGN